MPPGSGLVGRADELARLAERLAACRGGNGALVLVTGEPGVGKTRLAPELAELAAREGAAVVWGRCREDGGAPTYHPWVQILGAAAAAAGISPDHIRRAWPAAASLVSGETLSAAKSADPSQRFRLFASVAALLAELLERHAGRLSVDVVDTVAARTGGNPLFVIELAMLLRSAVGEQAEVAHSALPATVQEVVRKRVGRLPPETQRTLRGAAVLGRDFGRLPLAEVLEASQLAAVAALQPASAARLISLDPQGLYRFTHALVQAAVYATLPIAERTSLHRKATDAIAALGAIDDERLNDLAFHGYHASLDGDLKAARDHTLAAARRARQRLAFEDAARWYSLALDVAERGALPVSDLLDLLLEAAGADVSAGRVTSARTRYQRTAGIARQLDNSAALTRAALGLGSTVVPAGRVDWELVRLLEEAAGRAVSAAARARLESRLAIELYWHAGGGPSRTQSEAALRSAEQSGDAAALGVALHARQFTLRSPEHLDERIEIGDRLVRLAQAEGNAELAFQGRVWLAADVLRTADLARFRALVESLQAMAERSRLPLQRWYTLVMEAQLAAVDGRVELAYERTVAAGVLGSRLGHDVAAAYRLGQLCVLCREREGLGVLTADIEQVGARLPYFVTVRGFAALAAATTGHPDAAAWEIDRLSGDAFVAVPRDSLWVATIALLTEAAAICGSPHTRQLADMLAPHQGTLVVQGIPNCWGSVDRFLGRAALALGDLQTAEAMLHGARAIESRLAAPVFVARSTLDRARLAVSLGRRHAARRLVADVQATASRLNLTALSEEAARVLVGAGNTSRLSRREGEVLALLSAGASNKDIAAALVVSLNTVERHLANVYTKLGGAWPS